jgi:uncharacterized membrane protein YgcG
LIILMLTGCASGRKVIIKGWTEEIIDLQTLSNDVQQRDWGGPLIRVKAGITDQLTRTIYGMKNGKINSAQGAEVIARAEDAIDKIEETAKNPPGGHSGGGRRGGGGGAAAGLASGGAGGFGGGGRRHHLDDEDLPDDSESHGLPKELIELKALVDGYYLSAASAEEVTRTADPAAAQKQ